MLAVNAAFQVFAAHILRGDSGVFMSDARTDNPSDFYMGIGDYGCVDFETAVYPKYSVFDWKGENGYHYDFKKIITVILCCRRLILKYQKS